MPYARLEIPAGRSAAAKHALLEAVDAALVDVLGVPPRDAFLRLFEYTAENALLPARHGPAFTFVEIQLFPGRRPETKARLYRALVDALAALGIPPADITIALIEIAPADWGIAGGRPAAEIDPGFAVAI
jgi:phenylpyruvate tautomerase PptA (4-oxalocrotonate tautomerase family)